MQARKFTRTFVNLILPWLLVLAVPGQCAPFDNFITCIENKGLESSSNWVVTSDSNATLYTIVNHQWNLRVPSVDPLAYFLPRMTMDVQIAVKCAKKYGIHVTPQSGGHSFESYSFGDSETIVIDFREMQDINVFTHGTTPTPYAKIEAGALEGPIIVQLWNAGSYGLPLSACLTVGIGGLTLGGGTGYFAPAYGLTLDSLVELTMVSADGKAHTVNAFSNPRLFWALRGIGSGSIGIVTSFTFKLFNAQNMGVSLLTKWYDVSLGAPLIDVFQNWITWTQKHSLTSMNVLTFGPITNTTRVTGAKMRSYFIQDTLYTEGNETWAGKYEETFNTLELVPSNSATTYFPSYMDFILRSHFISVANKTSPYTEDDLSTVGDGLIVPRYLARKSFFVNKLFDSTLLSPLGELLSRIPESGLVTVTLWYEGGVVSNVPRRAMSYVHRNAKYNMQVEFSGQPSNLEAIAEAEAYFMDFLQVTHFMDSGEAYQNYLDGEREDYLTRHYGRNLMKLIRIKKQWDPENYFTSPQSVPLEMPELEDDE